MMEAKVEVRNELPNFLRAVPHKVDISAELSCVDHSELISLLSDRTYRVVANYRDSVTQYGTVRTVRAYYTIAEYLRAELHGERDMISEEVASSSLGRIVDLPNWVNPIGDTRLFCGKAGCVSDLHVDWFSHWLLHLTLMGNQRAFLFPPSAAALFKAAGNLACINFRAMEPSEKRKFLAMAGGFEVETFRGDALAIPPFWWHHFEYVEASIATSTGFGPANDYVNSFTTDARLPRDWRLAYLYSTMLRNEYLTASQRDACELVRESYVNSAAESGVRLNFLQHALVSFLDQSA